MTRKRPLHTPVLRAVLSHYRRHPLQLVALWLMLTLATALWSGVWTLTGQARDSMQAGEDQLGGQPQVVRSDGMPVTVADFVSLRREGLCVIPWLQVETGERGQVVGVDPLAMSCARQAAPDNGLALDGEPFVDISQAAKQAASGQPARLRLYLASENLPLPEGWQLREDPARLGTGPLADSFLLNLDALGVLVVLVSALLIRSVYTLGLAQRRQSLSLLGRYGVTRRRLRWALLVELLLLAALGVIPGYGLGLWLAEALAGGFGAAMDNLFETPLLATGESVTGFLVAVVMVLLVVLWCGLDLLRGRAARGDFHPWLGTGCLLAGLAILALAATLAMVFIGTALALAGVGLLTPCLLVRLFSPARFAAPLTLWRRRELVVLIRRLALPVVALQLAAGTVIAIHALVATFEETFQGWLGQRLAGDLYVEVPEGSPLAPAAAVLRESRVVAAWHPVIRGRATIRHKGDEQGVDLMATDAGSALIRQWSLLAATDAPWQALAEGDVMINEQLARRQGLGPGSALTLVVAGVPRQVAVTGVYADYGRPAGEVLLDMHHLPGRFAPDFRSLTIDLASGERGALVPALERAWKVPSLAVRDNETIHRLANRVFDQTFALTRSISYLTLSLAGLALLMTGWVVLRSRAWYYQLLSAWGLRHAERRRTVLLLAGELLAAIWVAALPAGVALTWVLVDRINPVAFGWSLPMVVYPGYWFELLLLFALAAGAIGWLASGGRGAVAPETGPLLEGGQER